MSLSWWSSSSKKEVRFLFPTTPLVLIHRGVGVGVGSTKVNHASGITYASKLSRNPRKLPLPKQLPPFCKCRGSQNTVTISIHLPYPTSFSDPKTIPAVWSTLVNFRTEPLRLALAVLTPDQASSVARQGKARPSWWYCTSRRNFRGLASKAVFLRPFYKVRLVWEN